jgi:hypothetical protein
MNALRLTAVATAIALLAACAPQRKPPPAPPAPAPRPLATSMPAPPPRVDWRDAPATPGSWLYRREGGLTRALFGPPGGGALLSLSCERAAGRVTLARSGASPAPVPLSITTTNQSRIYSATPDTASLPLLTVAFAPRDPMLDAIAFSRGRFLVEAPGLSPLYLPAWPEVARVIEDCR